MWGFAVSGSLVGFAQNIIFQSLHGIRLVKNNVRHKANKRSRYVKAPNNGALLCLVRKAGLEPAQP